MESKYQVEIEEFRQRFSLYKEKRIVIYGIGRYTATLLEGVKDFQFVGLMDKNPENIGKEMFQLPIVTMEQAEQIADMVLINTSETYWDVIYKRIEDIRIPVFYKNGELAQKKVQENIENPYKTLSLEGLKAKIEENTIVSFDFFDTLFMRKVCNPRDVFHLLEKEYYICFGKELHFEELRNKVKKRLKENYSLHELYCALQEDGSIPQEEAEWLENREIEFEKELLVPRNEIFECLKEVLKEEKQVYIISDMYLPKSFYLEAFKKYEVDICEGHILLSNELDLSKAEGTIWEYYKGQIVKNQSALHIGDHAKADIEIPKQYGISTYHTPSAWDLLSVSAMSELTSKVCTDYASAIIACILSKLFSNPYVLNDVNGKICVNRNVDMGYCVFGPIILTFLLWLLERKEKDAVEKIVFMSRDGYFLKENFDYLCKLLDVENESCYLGISRQLGMMSSCDDKEDMIAYASMPYTGMISELFEDRFGIAIIQDEENSIIQYIDKYYEEIQEKISSVKEEYCAYLENMKLNHRCAIVDLGYYGNNQRYLNKILGKKISGYYFNANCLPQNPNVELQGMIPCFQTEEDLSGERSQVLKKQIFLESYLTAPYGMIKEVKKDGTFICAEKKKNQECFEEKEEINNGVKLFLYDYVEAFGKYRLGLDIEFVDWYYGFCFSGAIEFSQQVKKSFYNDNAMMNRIESMLFY